MQDDDVPWVMWGHKRCQFLGLRAAGFTIPDCLDEMEGVTDDDISDWLRDADFAAEHDRMRADPMRYHRCIALPQKILMLDLLDQTYLASASAVKKGFSAKTRELIYTEAGLTTAQEPTTPIWQTILRAAGIDQAKLTRALLETSDQDERAASTITVKKRQRTPKVEK